VDLDAGGSLVALQQNHSTSSMEVMAYRGRRVTLAWRPGHEFAVGS
jgi:putative spermidine/putrescine transport system ATP-binding protein